MTDRERYVVDRMRQRIVGPGGEYTYPWLLIWIEHLEVSLRSRKCRRFLVWDFRLRRCVWAEPYARPFRVEASHLTSSRSC